jgi:mono/diheme cytochrome c family protein
MRAFRRRAIPRLLASLLAVVAASAFWLGRGAPLESQPAFAEESLSAASAEDEAALAENSASDAEDLAYEKLLQTGQILYATHCANCHGDGGDGQGPAAYLVHPKPRDFRSGTFRFRTTKSGQLPTIDDLMRTIRVGIPGAAMPAYGNLLSEYEIEALAEHVTTYSDRFQDDYEYDVMETVDIPAAPAEFTPAMAARGREVYKILGCSQCHGDEGRGDGPSARQMVDERGFPTPPKDFSLGFFKSGHRPEDLYRTIYTGLNGTGMPAFGDLFEPSAGLLRGEEDVWALVAYIFSQSKRGAAIPGGEGAGALLRVAEAPAAAMMAEPFHSDWESVPVAEVALRPLWTRGDYPLLLSVRVARRGSDIAFLLEWDDATKNVGSIGPTDFPDKASLAFPLTDDGLPFIGMGSWIRGEDKARQSLVNIWCWRADIDADRQAGRFGDIRDKYPLAHVDWYPFKEGWKPGQAEDLTTDRPEEHNPTFLTGWGAGNAVSDPARPEREITEFDAAGFGTLTPQPMREQHVSGRGEWKVGRWRVLFVRKAYTGGDGDAILTGERSRMPVSFAIWDGAYNDRDGIKSISNWHWLAFDGDVKESESER